MALSEGSCFLLWNAFAVELNDLLKGTTSGLMDVVFELQDKGNTSFSCVITHFIVFIQAKPWDPDCVAS